MASKKNPSTAAPLGLVVDTPLGLNLREGPGREHAVREVLADGTHLLDATAELPEDAKVPGWAFVREPDGGPAGWVDASFVRPAEG